MAGRHPCLSPDPGWAGEISLDVETVHVICQDCKIILVEANTPSLDDLAAAENEAVALGATIVTNSYGAPEGTDPATSIVASDFATFAPAYRHSGVIILASTGDDAFAGGTQFPADVNDVVAVGGTTLTDHSSTGAWQGETAWYTPASGGEPNPARKRLQHLRHAARVAVGRDRVGGDRLRQQARGRRRLRRRGPRLGPLGLEHVPGGMRLDRRPGNRSLLVRRRRHEPRLAAHRGGLRARREPPDCRHPGSLPYGHFGSLHDVASGSTGSCGSATICSAAAGYDGPTGMGTPNGLAAFSIGTPSVDGFTPRADHRDEVTITGRASPARPPSSSAARTPQHLTIDSDTQITATVGAGTTTGPISVDDAGRTAVSAHGSMFLPAALDERLHAAERRRAHDRDRHRREPHRGAPASPKVTAWMLRSMSRPTPR